MERFDFKKLKHDQENLIDDDGHLLYSYGAPTSELVEYAINWVSLLIDYTLIGIDANSVEMDYDGRLYRVENDEDLYMRCQDLAVELLFHVGPRKSAKEHAKLIRDLEFEDFLKCKDA